jgi:crotonobetainyl-CoA:carnitine CoA-transferase CaiB-like acyl-CoA transferase
MAALDGIRVIDFGQWLAGPLTAMMLADQGAEVIHVDPPGGPRWKSPANATLHRGKQRLTLDLKSSADVAYARRLIETADVVIENFRPGVMDRLGFSTATMHELNPRLVVLSITGFGHDGPEGGRAGYDQIAQGEAGLMSLTGSGPDDPQRVGVPIADLLSGMYGAYGVLAALHERERTGKGTVVRTSLLASVVGVHAFQGTRWTVAGEVGRAQGNHHPSIAPYGLFHCRDGAVQIALGSEGLWKKFCAGFGLDPDAEGLATNGERVARREQVIAVVEQAFADWDAEPLLARLAEIGIPAGKVRTLDEVYEWDQVASQGLLVDVEHPTLGGITLPGPPLRFFDAEGAEVTRRDHVAPPLLDQHADAIRTWVGGGGA